VQIIGRLSWFIALLLALTMPVRAQSAPGEVIYTSPDNVWSVESLGGDVYLFRWWPGFYVSLFVVGENGVLAVDPINQAVAPLYQAAIAKVTDRPITKIVYSHDHRDHIVGADVLSPDAEIIAHPLTLERLQMRGDTDIPLPTVLVEDGDRIELTPHVIDVHYFGFNHGMSNIALSLDTGIGRLLVFVDTLEIGIVPFRTLPDTDIGGYIKALAAATALDVEWVLGGHSGPGPAIWIENFLHYFQDMRAATIKASSEVPPTTTQSVSDVIEAGEEQTDWVVQRVVTQMRPKYGDWRGFEAWAPLNTQAMLMHLATGN
jgi:glyoxylase-like metal-dependent hydrolase (beta-lactamase superfamily II)